MKRGLVSGLATALVSGCGYWSNAPVDMNTAPTTWVATQAPTAVHPSEKKMGGRGDSVEERLQNLQQLRSDGLISDAEYRERRQKVIEEAL